MSLRRDAILREMGLAPVWRLRGRKALPEPESVLEPAAPRPVSEPAQSSVRSDLRDGVSDLPQPVSARSHTDVGDGVMGLGWDALEARIRGCEACGLCRRRKQAVPGVGDRQADWLFVGEGPGAEEDERGEPFVGQAGRLLDAMLASIDLKRGEDVYIANAVKCRPPNNRTPEAAELAACFPYLQRQIALIQPRLIVALGRPAAQALLNEEVRIAAARGKLYSHGGIPVVVTYHPAYLLRNLQDKAKAWDDLCFARRSMRGLKHA
ncbi:uracil-DNA glycosylase family protein [Zoogloea sp.]|uniref:uracil-DNA glycosylase n=1 Tax=Zoogloea sp. TaxID=49181 RepID=UPI0035AFEC47